MTIYFPDSIDTMEIILLRLNGASLLHGNDNRWHQANVGSDLISLSANKTNIPDILHVQSFKTIESLSCHEKYTRANDRSISIKNKNRFNSFI